MRLLAFVGAALVVQCVNAGFGHAHPQNPLNGGGKREVVAKREEELAPCPEGVPEDSGYPFHWPSNCKREAVAKRQVKDDECSDIDCWVERDHVCCKRKREVVVKREEGCDPKTNRGCGWPMTGRKREVEEPVQRDCTKVDCSSVRRPNRCCDRKREIVAKREEELAPCPEGVPEDSGPPYHWPTKCKREVEEPVQRDCTKVDCSSVRRPNRCCDRKREVVTKREDDRSHPQYSREVALPSGGEDGIDDPNYKREAVAKREEERRHCKNVNCEEFARLGRIDTCCIHYKPKREVVAKEKDCSKVDCNVKPHECCPHKREVVAKREAPCVCMRPPMDKCICNG